MKIRVLITLFIVFISCKNVTEKETEQGEIVIDSIGLKIKTVEKQIGKVKTKLEFEKLSKIIKSNFEIENFELKEIYKPWEKEYYTLIDSNTVKSFKMYSDFLIIEFDNSLISESEFDKIKTVAKKSLINKKELFDYYGVFRKGGVSFNQIDKWIIVHFLRCNMYPKDYEIDKHFTSELENLNLELDWVRLFCGWGKLELK